MAPQRAEDRVSEERQREGKDPLATWWPDFIDEDPSAKPLKTDVQREKDAYEKWDDILRERSKLVPLPDGRESNALLQAFRIPKIWGLYPGAVQAREIGLERVSVKVMRGGVELREIQTVDSRPS